MPRIEGTLRKVLAGVRAECPMAAAGSPQDPESTQLIRREAGGACRGGTRSGRSSRKVRS
jgi:hypothetical protein